MERAVLAGEALADDLGVLVDEDGHYPTLLRQSSLILNLSSDGRAESGQRLVFLRRCSVRKTPGIFMGVPSASSTDRVVGIFPGGHPLGAVRRRSLAKRGAELHRLDEIAPYIFAVNVLGADAAGRSLAVGAARLGGDQARARRLSSGTSQDFERANFPVCCGVPTSLRTARFIAVALASSAAKSSGAAAQKA